MDMGLFTPQKKKITPLPQQPPTTIAPRGVGTLSSTPSMVSGNGSILPRSVQGTTDAVSSCASSGPPALPYLPPTPTLCSLSLGGRDKVVHLGLSTQ